MTVDHGALAKETFLFCFWLLTFYFVCMFVCVLQTTKWAWFSVSFHNHHHEDIFSQTQFTNTPNNTKAFEALLLVQMISKKAFTFCCCTVNYELKSLKYRYFLFKKKNVCYKRK